MAQPRILIILPAYNEAPNIQRVIRNIRACLPMVDVLVINDGSRDATGHLAAEAGALVLNMPYNVGIGAAVQTGFQFAARYGYDIVIRNDGDGQHAPQDIPKVLDALHNGVADVVVGSRWMGDSRDYGTPLSRRLGIALLSRLLTLICRQPITDPTSGFSGYNQRAIRLFAANYPHDYPEPEAIVILRRAGLRLQEIPVTMHARQYGESSITPIRSVYYMIKVTLAILINMLRRAPAL